MGTSQRVEIVRGACPHDCPDACALLVTVEDGRVTGVRGDREHPFTRGSLCPKVNDYEAHVYHPDRVLHPLRRVGPKGSGRFERIGWDDALDEVCDRFRRISDDLGPEAILPWSYAGNMGLLNGIPVGDPFMHRLGATVLERTTCVSCRSTAYMATLGPAVIDPESIVHSRYIVFWGANPLSSNQHLWPLVRRAQKAGAKVVVIDAYRTRTAEQADWFIPIRPGTDGALALGIIHVLSAEGLTDDEYVRDHTVGVDDLARRAGRFNPERVEELTGVPADDVRRLARELASVQPSLIKVGVAIERSAQGGQAFRAIFSIPALTGSWRHVGGGLMEMPLWAFPVKWDTLSRPEWARPGTRVVNMLRLGDALTGAMGLDPGVAALFVYNGNPAVAAPDQEAVLRGLARDDLFTVVSDLFITDTARYADIVLPATSWLEHFDLTWSYGHCYLTANVPAVEPVGEAVSNTELFRRLAARMGFTDEWFKLTDEQMAHDALDWTAPALQGLDLESLKERGWARLNLPPADEWAPYAAGGFPTPSGKVELRSSLLEEQGDMVLSVFRQGYTGGWQHTPADPLPDFVPPPPSPYPLTMISPKARAFLNSQYANHSRQATIEGRQSVIMHPDDAARRGISSGDEVRVRNDLGSFTAVADLREGLAPGTVVCIHGAWQADGAATINATVSSSYTDLGHGPRFGDVCVDVERA